MPAALVAKLAESTDIDIAEAEKRWNRAKAITTEEKGLTDKDGDAFWQYVTGVFKRSMGIGAVMEAAGDGRSGCPVCGVIGYQVRAKCRTAPTTCDNGHRYYVCPVHGKAIPGDLDQEWVGARNTCLCDGAHTILESASAEEIHAAAHEAATSHLNGLPQPTEGQVLANNYKKGHIRLHGLDISIENPKGSTREGIDPDGVPWKTVLPAHYGDVRGTLASDGDPCDVYIGDHPESERVFVVDQCDLATGFFDEHKSILGARDQEEAREIYCGGFSDGKGPDRIGAITEVSISDFKAWLKTHKTKKPMSRILESAGSVFRAGTKAPENDGVYLLQNGSYARYEGGKWYREFADVADAEKTIAPAGFMSPQFRTRESYRWKEADGLPSYVTAIQSATSVADIEAVFAGLWPGVVPMATTVSEKAASTDMDVPGFKRFSARWNEKGGLSFSGTAQVLGQPYFFSLETAQREDGTPRISYYKFETFTGKSVRGAANVKLEGLMDVAKEHAMNFYRLQGGAA